MLNREDKYCIIPLGRNSMKVKTACLREWLFIITANYYAQRYNVDDNDDKSEEEDTWMNRIIIIDSTYYI